MTLNSLFLFSCYKIKWLYLLCCCSISLQTHTGQITAPPECPACLLTPSPYAKECPCPGGRDGTWLHVCAKCKSPTAVQLPPHRQHLPFSLQPTAGLSYFTRESSWIELVPWKPEALRDGLSHAHVLSIMTKYPHVQCPLLLEVT